MHWKDVECRRLISCINPAFPWKSLSHEGRPPSLKPALPKYDTGFPTVQPRFSENSTFLFVKFIPLWHIILKMTHVLLSTTTPIISLVSTC